MKKTFAAGTHGFNFAEGTPEEVVKIIDRLRSSRDRVIITLGDLKTGKPWNEEHDIEGYIGQSTGPRFIPLLVNNARSLGGGGLMTDCILRIRYSRGLGLVYQAANFQAPKIDVYANSDGTRTVKINGEIYAPNCSEGTAKRLIRIMA